jgi:integrase
MAHRTNKAEPGRDQVRLPELYTLRHTCLTRWAPHMDPWTLAYLDGHRDMNITKRYVHPQEQTIRAAMDRARGIEGGHTFWAYRAKCESKENCFRIATD